MLLIWNRELAAYRGKTWLEVPWYFAETCFYCRLLEAVRYFQPGSWKGRDPFEKQKRQQEEVVVERLADAWVQIADVEPGVVFEIHNWTLAFLARSDDFSRWWRSKSH